MSRQPRSQTVPLAVQGTHENNKTTLRAACATIKEMIRWRGSLFFAIGKLDREGSRLQGNDALVGSILHPDSQVSPKVVDNLALAFKTALDPGEGRAAGDSTPQERKWAQELRDRDAQDAARVMREVEQLGADITRYQDAHAIVMEHVGRGKLTDGDIGALAVLAIARPLTEHDPGVVERHTDQALVALTKLEVLTSLFDDLLAWASEELKGKELAVVERICENGGRISLEQLAKDPQIKWQKPFDSAYNGIRSKVNKKLEKQNNRQGRPCLPCNLRRHENCAVIEHF
jgi:hypothetical protein